MKSKRNNKRIANYIRGSMVFFLAAAVFSLISIVFSFLSPQIIRITVDNVIGNDEVETQAVALFLRLLGGRELLAKNLLLCGLAIAVSALTAGVFNALARVNISKGTAAFALRLREALLSHVERLPLHQHNADRSGDIIQRCTVDVETLLNFISQQLTDVLRTVLLLTVALISMFSMNPKLAWIFTLSVPIITGYSLLFHLRISRQYLDADEREGELLTGVQENLSGVRVVRAFGRERQELEKFDRLGEAYVNSWVKMGYTMGLFWGMGDLATCLQTLSILCAGAFFCVHDDMSLGVLLAFISYTHTLSSPVRQLGRSLSEFSQATVSARRLQDVLDKPTEADPPEALRDFPDGDLCFENVSFSYGDREILKNISFTLPRGQTLGILGATGSGKSTLIYLCNRLLDPTEGRITIGGTDIRQLSLPVLRRHVGLVLQEPYLFSGSIRENLLAGLSDDIQSHTSDNTPAESLKESNKQTDYLRHYTEIAAVDKDILSFAQGYETTVGERGVTLSGGQKQRIAIARALAVQSPILIFDDSLSAVDMETDKEIREALRTETSDTTVILISHRINTLMDADQILVLEDGRITARGTHEELLAEDGLYSRVTRLQAESGMKGGEVHD